MLPSIFAWYALNMEWSNRTWAATFLVEQFIDILLEVCSNSKLEMTNDNHI